MNAARLMNMVTLVLACVGLPANCVSQEPVEAMTVVGDSLLQVRSSKAVDMYKQNKNSPDSLLETQWEWPSASVAQVMAEYVKKVQEAREGPNSFLETQGKGKMSPGLAAQAMAVLRGWKKPGALLQTQFPDSLLETQWEWPSALVAQVMAEYVKKVQEAREGPNSFLETQGKGKMSPGLAAQAMAALRGWKKSGALLQTQFPDKDPSSLLQTQLTKAMDFDDEEQTTSWLNSLKQGFLTPSLYFR